jgi:hypothetical protein
MLDLRRSLLLFTAVAAAAMVALSAPRSAPVALTPSFVDAYPELPPRDSLASLLVSSARDGELGRPSRGETAYLLDVIAALDDVPERSGRVAALEEIAVLPVIDSAVVAALARATNRLARSGNRLRILDAVIRHQPLATGRARRDVLDAIRSIPSSGGRADVLEVFVRRPGLTEAGLIDALAHVPALSSSADRSRVLVAAARTHRIGGRARTAYVRTVKTMTGRHRSRALDALNRASTGEGGA